MSEQQKFILIVEDNPGLSRALELKLNQFQFKTESIANGIKAIKKIKSQSKPNLVLLDLGLPGKNGLEILEAIKDEKIPIVVVSNLREDYLKDVINRGAIKYFVKAKTPILEIINFINDFFKK